MQTNHQFFRPLQGLSRARFGLMLALMVGLHGCGLAPPSPASASAIPPASILLLGEVHDNANGHHKRRQDLARLLERGWRPALVMEQFDRENQVQLDRAMQNCANAACVTRMVGSKGWDWEHYEPLIALALSYRLPVWAGNISRTDAAKVMKSGWQKVLGESVIAPYGLQNPMPAPVYQGQLTAIEQGHCGHAPATLAGRMVMAQVARDVWMAEVLRQNAKTGAVLIAGNGHVRRDVGVPFWLNTLGIDHHATGYLEQADVNGPLLYHTVVPITPQDRADPCSTWQSPAKPS